MEHNTNRCLQLSQSLKNVKLLQIFELSGKESKSVLPTLAFFVAGHPSRSSK